MVDVAHWLTHVKKVKEVIAVARRGPAQRAYTDVEIQAVSANIDTAALRQELERIRPRLEAVGEEIEPIYQNLTKHVNVKAKEGESPTRMLFRFLSAPSEVLVNEHGWPRALRIENTELVKKGEDLSAKGLGTFDEVEADTIIFAIGDRVDETLGLPCGGTEYVKNPHPDPVYPGDEAYQVFDPQTGNICEGLFVIGWSRKASDGLVGKAKQDGERGIVAVNHFLQKVTSGSADGLSEKLGALRKVLQSRSVQYIDYADVQKLENIEKNESQRRGVEFFKYTTDAEMLAAIEKK
jgi:ferredoxin--NADP+ reductase